MSALNKLFLRSSIQPSSSAVHNNICMFVATEARAAALVCSDQVLRWSSCNPCVAREMWLLGARPQGTRAGSGRANQAEGCGHDVITCRGRSEASPSIYVSGGTWVKMISNRFPLACYQSVDIRTYVVKDGLDIDLVLLRYHLQCFKVMKYGFTNQPEMCFDYGQ